MRSPHSEFSFSVQEEGLKLQILSSFRQALVAGRNSRLGCYTR